tara:strand:- start:2539 stop:2970 length:432 start_codon:yes stop_codon:yes gene_type:complete
LSELSILLLGIGAFTLVFGFLLVFFPNVVLRTQIKANKLYLTDSFVMKNRVTIGMISSIASLFMLYVFYSSVHDNFFLIIGIIAGVYGILLVYSPRSLLTLERHANRIYMTDDFFFNNKNIVGGLLVSISIYMIYTYTTMVAK